jgi:A/G-specific adenine glycosylase
MKTDKNLDIPLIIKDKAAAFAYQLLEWNRLSNDRKMPWKGEKDPYKIWLSEVILQQTRVEQGLKYYENFILRFPDIMALARADDKDVFKLWEGLGYYSRCRNLLHTARFIAFERQGKFPLEHAEIQALKGVGTYTAAAIASFAYNAPYAVLDGNVFRVLSRIFSIDIPVDSSQGKKYFTGLAQSLLPSNQAGSYNQAIMDFGATICKPVPLCSQCFYQMNCLAFLEKRQMELPVKEKKAKVRERFFNYMILKWKGKIAIQQRTAKDVWQGLYEFLLLETSCNKTSDELLRLFSHHYPTLEIKSSSFTDPLTQKLSHQKICFRFAVADLNKKPSDASLIWVKPADLDQYPFPVTLKSFLSKAIL